jgi:hypothetical protein
VERKEENEGKEKEEWYDVHSDGAGGEQASVGERIEEAV